MPRNRSRKIKKSKSAPTSPRASKRVEVGCATLDVPAPAARGSSASSDFDTDDSMSLCSELIIDCDQLSPFDAENEEQEILDLLEDFGSRGETSRREALQNIFDKLSHRVCEEFISSHLDEFLAVVRASISPSQNWKEIELGCKVAAVTVVSIGGNECESFVNDVLIGLLTDLIRSGTANIGVEVIGIDCLSFLCYFGANVDGMEFVMDLLCEIWQSTHHDETHPKVIDAALQGWTFLMSKLDKDALVEFAHEKISILLKMMKSSTDSIVRLSLGESLSLYCDAWASMPVDARRKFPINLAAIRAEFDRLAGETGRQRRAALRLQKTKFRQFFKALPRLDGDNLRGDNARTVTASMSDELKGDAMMSHERVHRWRPTINLHFRSRVYAFEGWNRYIEYHRIKEMLGSGTQTHLFANPRLQAVFDLEGVVEELRMSPSKNDKERKKRVFVDNARRNQDDKKRGRRDKFERMNRFDDNSIW